MWSRLFMHLSGATLTRGLAIPKSWDQESIWYCPHY